MNDSSTANDRGSTTILDFVSTWDMVHDSERHGVLADAVEALKLVRYLELDDFDKADMPRSSA